MVLTVGSPFPPRTVTMVTGPPGSAYDQLGARYQEVLRRAGIDLRVIRTAGGVENLARLQGPASGVQVGFLESGKLLAKAPPRDLKARFRSKLLELDVEPVMPALIQFRNYPGVLGVSLRSGSLRIYAANAQKLLEEWKREWPADGTRFVRERWVDPDMQDVFTAYSQRYDALLNNE